MEEGEGKARWRAGQRVGIGKLSREAGVRVGGKDECGSESQGEKMKVQRNGMEGVNETPRQG